MVIYSYETILARPEAKNNGAQEDSLVKWFVILLLAYCATLPFEERLVFKVLPEFTKADVLVRLATDAVDDEDEWIDRRVWIRLQFKSADVEKRGRWVFHDCLGYTGMLVICGGAKVRGVFNDYHLWAANGASLCKKVIHASRKTHKLSMGDNTTARGNHNSNATMVDTISIPDLVAGLRRTIRTSKEVVAEGLTSLYPLVSGHEARWHIQEPRQRKEAILIAASKQVHSTWEFADMEGNQTEVDAVITKPDGVSNAQYKWYMNEWSRANLNHCAKGLKNKQPYSIDTPNHLFIIGCILKLDDAFYLAEAHLTKAQLLELGYLSAPGVKGKVTICLPRLREMGHRGKKHGDNFRLLPIGESYQGVEGIGFRPLVPLTPTRMLTAEMLDSVAVGRCDLNRDEVKVMIRARTANAGSANPEESEEEESDGDEIVFTMEEEAFIQAEAHRRVEAELAKQLLERKAKRATERATARAATVPRPSSPTLEAPKAPKPAKRPLSPSLIKASKPRKGKGKAPALPYEAACAFLACDSD